VELILDTNAVSALADGHAEAVHVLSRADAVSLPVIVLGEFRFGIAHSRLFKAYTTWLADLIASSRVMDIRDSTARYYAEIRSELKKGGTPLPSNDVWIAALCREHRLPLLSRNRHFDAIKGLKRVGWKD
jgi:tRNA(fMet)-specific endonuclease VapC